MLKQESLVSLFSLLEEMTLVKRDKEAFISLEWIRRLEFLIIFGGFVFGIMLIISELIQYMFLPLINPFFIKLFRWFLIFFGIIYMFIQILDMAIFLFRRRKQGASVKLSRLKNDMLSDVGFLNQLLCYEKATLEYALLQYRNNFDNLDGRVGFLIGDLRRNGLFPAFLALFIAASNFMKDNRSVYFFIILIPVAFFYLFGIYLRGRQERAKQVVDLIDYAILHADVMAEES
ncbi:hypothetical protein [Xanthomonas albilineans]|uniref:hypothetical protein n=1 Tax=Xanthomonas albilineans TaxID=29447 RepID=UPI0005F32F1C|nr:hypothetical protein [Xanthomonas albilineans]